MTAKESADIEARIAAAIDKALGVPPPVKPLWFPPDTWKPAPALVAQDNPAWHGHYADGMMLDDEQRARAEWLEIHGMRKWHEATDHKTEPPK